MSTDETFSSPFSTQLITSCRRPVASSRLPSTLPWTCSGRQCTSLSPTMVKVRTLRIRMETPSLTPLQRRLHWIASCRAKNWLESCRACTLSRSYTSAMLLPSRTPTDVRRCSHFRTIIVLTGIPKAAPYDIMVNDGRVLDIDKDDWDRW